MENKILKGILFEEINRAREIMGLPTLTEQKVLGKLYDDAVGSLFGNLSKKGVKELSQEQQDALNKLIINSSEIQRAGIKSIKDVLDDAGKQLLLKTIRDNSDAIKTTFDGIVSDYTKNTMTIINKRLNSIPNLKTEISKLKSGNFTALSILQKIEREGTENISSYHLLGLKNTLTDAKTTFKGNREMTDYLDGVIKQVDGVINSKQIDISTVGKGSVDNVVGKAVDNVVGKVSDNLKIDMSKDDLLSVIDDVFPGNVSIRQEIEKISEVDLKKSQDEFNKLSDEEVDNAINKVCGTLKEGISINPVCELPTNEISERTKHNKELAKYYKSEADVKTSKAQDIDAGGTLAKSRASRFGRYFKFTLSTLLAGGIVTGAAIGGKMGYDKFFTYDNTPEGFKEWVKKEGYRDADYSIEDGYTYTDENNNKQEATYDRDKKTFY